MYLWNALRIGGILSAVAYGCGALGTFIAGLIAAGESSTVSQQATPRYGGLVVEPEAAENASRMMPILFIITGVLVLACVFSGVLTHLTEQKMKKAPAIALAILSFLVGAFFPGALFLIDAIQTR